MDTQIAFNKEKVHEFCQRWEIIRLEIFGSAVTGNFTKSSDVDLLVEFSDPFKHDLADYLQMQDEIESIFEREVDLIPRKTIESSRNPYKKQNILENARSIYAVG